MDEKVFKAVRAMLSQDQVLRDIATEKGLSGDALLAEYHRRMEGIPDIPRYEIRERLGEGAVAVVYRAVDRQLGRAVALKLIRAGLSDEIRARFIQEAKLAATLAHPNVVTVFDAGEADGRPFIVMELVDGKSPERLTIEQLAAAAEGVAAAHAKGIVHRDLKPANILGGKVSDFGLAHVDQGLTRAGATLGTPRYMAPEQVSGGAISPATDVYALGVMLFESLTGRPPHSAETLRDLYEKIIREEPTLPAGPLETVCLKALSKSPQDRYPSAKEFAEDLRRHRAGRPIQGRRARRFPKWVLVAPVLLLVLWHLWPAESMLQAKSEAVHRKIQDWQSNGLDPTRLAQHVMLASKMMEQGKPKEAETILDEALKLEPTQERIQLKVRHVEQGIQNWQRAGRDLSPIAKIMSEVEEHMRAGRFPQAEAALDRALETLRK